ncbi:hypothetical protein Tco_1069691 [Tanacetum coccineum]|uniref:Uncharacterized protein n=1 Tax=Tanacetum coccineum TaxID=301880 RepID=A0ABQ5HKN7_9ASTR
MALIPIVEQSNNIHGKRKRDSHIKQPDWDTQESITVHMVEGVVEHVVADGLVQDQIIDKVVVAEEGVAVSSST